MTRADDDDKPRVDRGSIAGAAVIIGLGNLLSRALGLVREIVITHQFGAEGTVSAFRNASRTYNLLFELLIGGLIASALVPVLSEYCKRDNYEFRKLLGTLTIWVMGIGSAVVLVLAVFTPSLSAILSAGFDASLRQTTTDLIRIVLPAVLLMSLAGLLSAAMYAQQRFFYPAFMAALFNMAIILSGWGLARWLDVRALAIGVVAGAILQLGLQVVGVIRTQALPVFGIRHPALKQIFILALPVLFSLIVGQAQVVIDSNLASRTGEQSIAWMANATTLIQLPLGLVATAISLAILPRLSRHATEPEQLPDFVATLAFGVRIVILLIIPATLVLVVIGRPIIELVFEHGNFLSSDTEATATALLFYSIGLPFAALDQILVLAFYARRDTTRPALVGIGAVGIYLAVALLTMRSMGMTGLVLANSIQWLAHAVIMLGLTRVRIGSMIGEKVPITLGRALLSGVFAALFMRLLFSLIVSLALPPGMIRETVAVLVPLFGGGVIYLVALIATGCEDIRLLFRIVVSRFRSFSHTS